MRTRDKYLISIPIPEGSGFIIDASLFLFLISIICARILFHSNLALTIAIVCLAIVGLLGLYKIIEDKNKYCIAYVIFMLIMWGVVAFFKNGHQYYQAKDIINTLFFIGVSYLLLTTQKNYIPYRILYYFVSCFFLIEIVVLKKPIIGLLADGNTYNYISCYVIVFFVIYALVLLKAGKKPGIIDSVLLVGVVMVSFGRGGIISGVFYALGFAMLKLYEKRSKPYTYVFIMSIVSVGTLFFHRLVSMVLSDERLAKFAQNGLDSSGRDYLWKTFLSRSGESVYSFFLGADPEQIRPDGNLHNSFLQMWASLGFVFFIVSVLLILICIVKCVQNREWYFLLLLGTFFLRAFTDKMMYRWYGEIIMYYCVLRLMIGDLVPQRQSKTDGISKCEIEG